MEVTWSKMELAAWVPLQHLSTASLGTTASPGKREGGREGGRKRENPRTQNRGKTISHSPTLQDALSMF